MAQYRICYGLSVFLNFPCTALLTITPNNRQYTLFIVYFSPLCHFPYSLISPMKNCLLQLSRSIFFFKLLNSLAPFHELKKIVLFGNSLVT